MTYRGIINKIGHIRKKVSRFIHVEFGKGIAPTHNYLKYEDYINHQKEKTSDPERIKSLFGEKWEVMVNGFKESFAGNWGYIKDKKKAVCLGARTGQEVKALIDLGISAIGVDLVPFQPYTIEGDIHNLDFNNGEFDLVFTNIFDHTLYPKRFCSEMERVTKGGGIIIIHLLLGSNLDKYTETIVCNPRKVIKLFRSIEVKESRRICNSFNSSNWELILKKK